ncbi:hypothetical protein BT69DRAFT_1223412, partial [Atractiella rhizophila]
NPSSPGLSINTVSEQTSINPGLSSPPGLSRRPRAGTLPSTFHLGGAGGTNGANVLGLSRPDNGLVRKLSGLSQSQRGTSPSTQEFSNAARLSGRLGAATSLDLVTQALRASASDRNAPNRLRSGSLTLPNSLSSPFGNVFGSTWGSSGENRIPEELRSNESFSSHSSMMGEDVHQVRTLDYLGLDDSPIQGFATSSPMGHPQSLLSASNSNLRSTFLENQSHLTRMRSNTVAGLARVGREPIIGRRTSPYHVPSMENLSSLSEKVHEEDENLLDSEEHFASPYTHSDRQDSEASTADSSRLFYSSQRPTEELHPPSLNIRPRASTVGMLDDNIQILARRRAGTTSGITPRLLDVGPPTVLLTPTGPLTPTDTANRLQVDQVRLHTGSRPITPETRDLTPPPQQPSRSLWIGNLDSSTSAQELMQVFAPYGAIESLRLLPEKECGFVNFVNINDAIRAKDDVLNRLGSSILSKGPTVVRIGYGKVDSVPATPSSGLHNRHSGNNNNNNNNSMDPSLQTSPTRALWVGSIPSHTTPSELLRIFSPYGPIESARVLTHKNCGFINFERLDDAVCARKALNGREILGSEVGAVRIGFAKVPNKVGPGLYTPGSVNAPAILEPSAQATATAYQDLRHVLGATAVPLEQQMMSGALENYRSNLIVGLTNGNSSLRFSVPQQSTDLSGLTTVPLPSITDMQLLMKELGGDDPENSVHLDAVKEFRPPSTYYTSIPAPHTEDPHSGKKFTVSDAPRLRDIRKKLDNAGITQAEVDEIATDLIEEAVVLSSDYIGNTLVQKFFERCSDAVRLKLLERIAPHLASIGCHKNGTWAAQKIIDCANTPEEMNMICQNIRPYIPPLLLDQYGNYVVQCTLRFGQPLSNLVFDSIVDRCWEVGQGRFGARSVRTCLESTHCSRLQMKRVAISIILNSIPLATNPNGALLLTWLLDTSGFPGRYRLLAPRLAPHLSHLCTHKLASLTVLRLINQKVDPDAAQIVLRGLFSSSPQVLEDILGDQVHGITVIQKILASTHVEPQEKQAISEKVRTVITNLRVQHIPAYKKLVEDLGMPYSSPPTTQSGTPSTHKGSPGYNRSSSWSTPQSQASGFPSPYQSTEYPSFVNALGQMQISNPVSGHPTTPPQSYSPMHPGGVALGSPMIGSPMVRHTSPVPVPYHPMGMYPPNFSPPEYAAQMRMSSPDTAGYFYPQQQVPNQGQRSSQTLPMPQGWTGDFQGFYEPQRAQ